jgi:hypothetical protein
VKYKMAKKPARKPALTPTMQDQIRTEYGLGATVAELSIKYDRGNSIISRFINGVSRDGEKLAHRLVDVQRELKGTHTEHEQSLILQRAKQIQEIQSLSLKGTNYITQRTLKKLQSETDDEINYNDLAQAQGVMTKANAIVEPKTTIENQTNTQVNLTVQFVK